MKFYILLIGQLMFFILSGSLTYQFLVVLEDPTIGIIGIIGMFLFSYLFIKVLNGYRRFYFDNNKLTIVKINGSRQVFKVSNILHWKETETNYRIRSRRLDFNDANQKSFINDWLDSDHYEEVYHYFRTHLRNKNTLYS